MAFVYYKYLTGFTNTIVDVSPTPFTLGPGEGQIFTNFEIPAIQPLYLYAESGGNVITNSDSVINAYLTSIGEQSSESIFTGYTASTNTRLVTIESNITYLSGQTASKVSNSKFNTYTGTTAPATYALKSNFNTYTGTTAPNTYLTKSSFNTYSGLTQTQINSKLSTSAFNTYSGLTQTQINSKLSSTAFNTYSGVTSSNISYISGQTALRLKTADFNVYSANTLTLIQASQAGLDPKESVFVATVAALGGGATYVSTGGTAGTGSFTSAPTTIDGKTLSNGKRVLVKNQTDPRQNGIYVVVSSGNWKRASDQDGSPVSEVSAGNYTFVETGSTNVGSGWAVVGSGILTLNVDPIIWTQFNASTGYIAGTGILITGNTISFNGSAVAGNALSWSGTQLNVVPTGGTLGTKFNTKLDVTAFNIYSGATQTQINSKLSTSSFNTYSASTLTNINSRLLKTDFNTYTGTTEPATYLKISNFNPYSASTLTNINSRLLTSLFSTYTGTTAPATFALKSNFNTFTGTTAPATYLKISNFNPYSASTLTNINSRLLTSNFNTYSASTLTNINSRLLTTIFNTFTGTTAPATYLKISAFNTYSGVTATRLGTIESLYVTGATNGLTKTGKKIKLGGNLTGATTIGLGTNNLTFSGTTGLVKYATDQSANYDKRTLIDQGYYSGNTLYTRAQLLVYASGVTDVNVTTAVSIPLNRLIRNNSTYFTYTGGTTIKILIAGTYDVSYLINGSNNNATAHSIAANVYKNGSAIAETTSTCSSLAVTAAAAALVLPPTQITFAVNDVIQLRAFRLTTGGGSFNTTANSVFLSIVKKY